MEEKITVVRSRRKTLCLTLGQEGVVVRAPHGVSREQIEKFVARHRLWIARRIAEREQAPVFRLEKSVTLFGKDYRILKGDRARMNESEIYLPERDAEQAFIRLVRARAKEEMSALTQRLAARCGFRYASVRITSARTRWGSCNSKGNIAYTFRVAFLPPAICEYVAVHELCHTVQLNHSARFWREVEKILPDWRARRAALRDFGGCMRAFPAK